MTGAHTIWFRGMKLAMGSHARKDGNLAAKCGKGLGLNEPENDWRGTGNGIFARALDDSFNCLLFPAGGQLLLSCGNRCLAKRVRETHSLTGG